MRRGRSGKMNRKSTDKQLTNLRRLMQNTEVVNQKLSAYIIPSVDAHHSDTTAICDRRLTFMSNFTGSSGTGVVTLDYAALWVPGLYHLQASLEIDRNWTLMKMHLPNVPTIGQWLCEQLKEGDTVGIDPYLCSKDYFLSLSKSLLANNVQLLAVSPNLVDYIWGAERPSVSEVPLFVHPIAYCGLTWQEKLAVVQQKMTDRGAQLLFLSALDEIAWLFNLRGQDIPHSQHFFAYAVIGQSSGSLFIDESKLTRKVQEYFTDVKMQFVVQPYNSARDYLILLTSRSDISVIWLPPETSYAFTAAVPEHMQLMEPSPISMFKAVKNSAELLALQECHTNDSMSLCLFFSWLNKVVMNKMYRVTEMSAASKLEDFRRIQNNYLGPSFPTISAVGSNASIIHYRPTEESDKELTSSQLYLLDSGGQYLTGTTDVTRTVMFETATDFQKECYTRVVKGHIALARQVFPEKTPGYLLDTFSRQFLWEIGLDYKHGTGHGVGVCSSVHEGPIGFGPIIRSGVNSEGLAENMIVTIEPGYYLDNEFGMRLENVYVVLRIPPETETKSPSGLKYPNNFLRFEPLTLVPIQPSLMVTDMLTYAEREWIDRYNCKCRDVVGEQLLKQGYQEAYQWLTQETQPLL